MRTSICVIIKDEHLYLQEWIEYHLALGFDDIFLFEDYESRPHDDIVSAYPQVHLTRMSEISPSRPSYFRQLWLFRYFVDRYKDQADWCLFTDIDEFLVFDEGYDLQRLVQEYDDAGAPGVALCWKIFNASGHITRPQGSVVESYHDICRQSDRNGGWDIKCLVNMQCVNGSDWQSIHKMRGCLRTDGVDPLCLANNRCYEKAWINHYYTKSWEDWVRRLQRGNMCQNLRTIDEFFYCNPDLQPMADELIATLHIDVKEFPYAMVLSRQRNLFVFRSNQAVIDRLNATC